MFIRCLLVSVVLLTQSRLSVSLRVARPKAKVIQSTIQLNTWSTNYTGHGPLGLRKSDDVEQRFQNQLDRINEKLHKIANDNIEMKKDLGEYNRRTLEDITNINYSLKQSTFQTDEILKILGIIGKLYDYLETLIVATFESLTEEIVVVNNKTSENALAIQDICQRMNSSQHDMSHTISAINDLRMEINDLRSVMDQHFSKPESESPAAVVFPVVDTNGTATNITSSHTSRWPFLPSAQDTLVFLSSLVVLSLALTDNSKAAIRGELQSGAKYIMKLFKQRATKG
jgi:gas vesicle protein